MMKIDMIPIISDNYAYYVESDDGVGAIIDPGEAAPIIAYLKAHNKTPSYIINTHHHWDHVNGNPKLQTLYDLPIAAPEKEISSVKGNVTIPLNDGDIFNIGNAQAHIIETPGHTRAGICLHFPEAKAVFTGDTLFSMGCGRLFEGTAADMYRSFQKLAALPDDTLVYCGHEYTKGNAGFCLAQDRENPALKKRIEEVKALRAQDKPTIPTTIGQEKATNIFMKAKSAEEFAALRQKKDNF